MLVRAVFGITPAGGRLAVALKAAAALALPLLVTTLAGRPELGMMSTLGAFAVLYGPTTALGMRWRLTVAIGAGLVGSVGLGVLTAGHGAATLGALVLVAGVASFVCNSLKVGPPGAYFFPLVGGVAGHLVGAGHEPGLVLTMAVVGALVALLVGTSDLVVDPRRPERLSVARAAVAVHDYEVAEGGDLPRAQATASAALHQAWTTVRDGGAHRRVTPGLRPLVDDLLATHRAYLDRTARLTREPAGSGTSEQGPTPTVWVDDGADRLDALEAVPEDDATDAEQLRESSLGRPDPGRLLLAELTWPSEKLLVAGRVLVATSVAGGAALSLGVDHVYWAVAFAMLALHQGGARRGQLVRALQRVVGTAAGLCLFGVVALLEPTGLWLVATVAALQLVVELLVVRSYALASAFITPLALTISTGGELGHDVVPLAAERGIDTLLGVAVSLVVIATAGRRLSVLLLRGQVRRCLVEADGVLAGIAEGHPDSPAGRRHRQRLYHELLELEETRRRALADDPGRVTPFVPVVDRVSRVGYLVLGAAWHRALRRERGSAERIRGELAALLVHPVTRRRRAGALEAELASVEALLGADRPGGGEDRLPHVDGR